MSSYDQMYRARQLGLTEHHTDSEWLELCDRFDNRCVRCGSSQQLTPDHIVPLSQHGSNAIDNIQPLCLGCNVSKKDTTADYRHNPFQYDQFVRSTNQISFVIPDELYAQLAERARKEQRTVSNLIVKLLTIAATNTERNTNAEDQRDMGSDIPH